MKLITEELLKETTNKAINSPRLRMNHNFHESMDEPLHRMLNALELGTEIPVHRHSNPDKEEIYLLLKGSVITYFFDDQGNIINQVEINPLKGVYGIDIPAGTWHTVKALESGTVIYEIKRGPFSPLTPENIADWKI